MPFINYSKRVKPAEDYFNDTNLAKVTSGR